MCRSKQPEFKAVPLIAVDVEINAEVEAPVEPREVREYGEFARLLREAVLKAKGGA